MKALTHFDIAEPLTNGPLLPFAEKNNPAYDALGNMIEQIRRSMNTRDRANRKASPFLSIRGDEEKVTCYTMKRHLGPRPRFTKLETRDDGASIGWAAIGKEGLLFWKHHNGEFHFVPWPFRLNWSDTSGIEDKCREVVSAFDKAKDIDIHPGALHRSFLGRVAYPFFGLISPSRESFESRVSFASDFAIWCSHCIKSIVPQDVLIAGRVVRHDGSISENDFAKPYPFSEDSDWFGIEHAVTAMRDIMNSKTCPITYGNQISHEGPVSRTVAGYGLNDNYKSAHQQMAAAGRINALLERARAKRPVTQENEASTL